MSLTLCLPLQERVRLGAWVRPSKAGQCCGPFGSGGLSVRVRRGAQDYVLTYLWAHSTQPNSKTSYYFRLASEDGWSANTWNHLDRDLHADLATAFGFTQFGNVMLVAVTVFNHYSNGDPGAFDFDRFELVPDPL